MQTHCHEHPAKPTEPTTVRQPCAVRAAFSALIAALNLEASTDADTAERAARLWRQHLVPQDKTSVTRAFGPGSPTTRQTPVLIDGLGFHLVCPHHLTVATGSAAIAYWPKGRLANFGDFTAAVHACTARPALQENASWALAHTIFEALTPRAVAVRLRAKHPCHTILHPRSHQSSATTWAMLGEGPCARQLQELLQPGSATSAQA